MKNNPVFLMNGAELAVLFDKSANTISAWTAKGMPVFKHGTLGKEHSYRPPHAFCWYLGKEALELKKLPLMDTLTMTLLGNALMAHDAELYSFAEWKPRAVKLTRALGYPAGAFDTALGELIATGMLVHVWPRTRPAATSIAVTDG